jgi:potassium efflux system protein
VLSAVAAFLSRPLALLGVRVSIGDLLLRLVLPVAAIYAVHRLLLHAASRLLRWAEPTDDQRRARSLQRVRFGLRIAATTAAILAASVFFGAEMRRLLSVIWKVLVTPFYSAGSTKISVATLLLTVPVFYAGGWLSKLVTRTVGDRILGASLSTETRFTVSVLLRNVVAIVVVLVGLTLIGIDLSALSIMLGVLGIGLGFGLQGIVSNFFAGLTLVFERPIKEGDRIQIGSYEGDITQVRLRSTVITTLTNETIIVPNRSLVEDSIHNFSYRDLRIVIVNRVQVSYSTDLDRAIAVLSGVSAANPDALADREPEVRVIEFQDSGILMELRTWIGDAARKHQALSWTNLEIWRTFRRDGIEIPFPQRDLHIKAIPAAPRT